MKGGLVTLDQSIQGQLSAQHTFKAVVVQKIGGRESIRYAHYVELFIKIIQVG